ncbi:uncharacterized protein LOC129725455 isoform X1 [Wyeomyia smithii]|uniref:uncharacterized protein LOC129725455 isoform X1 n=1 Tax=Wyeomyia smithii TaxID=174621 RepID=UPI002467B655|nr:uncharacterized protein LOC129725455 isoform X1 [Wyeomyia smithii]XP_055537301.1 uncharacterized protein LOC129725455 isoform X1 [Wyeomyia smithii]
MYSNALRERLLSNLLKLSSSGQNQFISNHIVISETSRQTVLNSRRLYTRKYFLPAIKGKIRVCKKMFESTLNIKDKKTRCLSKKMIFNNGMPYDDQRVKNGGQRRVPMEHIKYIENHINSFPAYASHYGREKSSKMYLSSDLSIAKMFRLYKKKCFEEGLEPVNYNSYRIVFGTFKLAFRRPSKDTCPECDKFAIKLKASSGEEKSNLSKLRDVHQHYAKRMYGEKKKVVCEAKNVEGVRTVSFDLQKCLPTPHLQCGTAYYSRQLYTFNFTIFSTEGNQNKADCYLWDETKAKRGSQEIGSCLLYDLNNIASTVKLVHFYSDRCFGQNLNFVICMTFLKFIYECHLIDREITIQHKFMVSGHSHMEVDSVHASIEKARKRCTINIETPRDWPVFIGSIERKVPFKVHELNQQNFKALKKLEQHFKRPTMNTIGQKIKFQL